MGKQPEGLVVRSHCLVLKFHNMMNSWGIVWNILRPLTNNCVLGTEPRVLGAQGFGGAACPPEDV